MGQRKATRRHKGKNGMEYMVFTAIFPQNYIIILKKSQGKTIQLAGSTSDLEFFAKSFKFEGILGG